MVQTLAKLCDDLRELQQSSAAISRRASAAPDEPAKSEPNWRDSLQNPPTWPDMSQLERALRDTPQYARILPDVPEDTPALPDTPQQLPALPDAPPEEPIASEAPERALAEREGPTGMHEVDTARFIDSHRKYIEEAGVRMRECYDLNTFRAVCDELQGKGFLSEPFHPDHMDIIPANAMLMVGENAAGEVVHVQAMRKDDLTGCTLADFWMKNLRRIHDGEIGEVHCPGARKITGQVVYHGELWVSAELRKYKLAATLARLAQAIALVRWNPDFIYGFVSSNLAQRGFPLREGYQHISPAGTDWRRSPSNVSGDDWLAWNAREDVRWLVTQPQIFSESP